MPHTIEQKREWARAMRRDRRDVLAKIRAETPCADCGEPSQHFHHIDKSTKLFTIGQGSSAPSMAALLAEVAKCVLLCSGCHYARHRGEPASPATRTALDKARHVRWHVRRGKASPTCAFCAD